MLVDMTESEAKVVSANIEQARALLLEAEMHLRRISSALVEAQPGAWQNEAAALRNLCKSLPGNSIGKKCAELEKIYSSDDLLGAELIFEGIARDFSSLLISLDPIRPKSI